MEYRRDLFGPVVNPRERDLETANIGYNDLVELSQKYHDLKRTHAKVDFEAWVDQNLLHRSATSRLGIEGSSEDLLTLSNSGISGYRLDNERSFADIVEEQSVPFVTKESSVARGKGSKPTTSSPRNSKRRGFMSVSSEKHEKITYKRDASGKYKVVKQIIAKDHDDRKITTPQRESKEEQVHPEKKNAVIPTTLRPFRSLKNSVLEIVMYIYEIEMVTDPCPDVNAVTFVRAFSEVMSREGISEEYHSSYFGELSDLINEWNSFHSNNMVTGTKKFALHIDPSSRNFHYVDKAPETALFPIKQLSSPDHVKTNFSPSFQTSPYYNESGYFSGGSIFVNADSSLSTRGAPMDEERLQQKVEIMERMASIFYKYSHMRPYFSRWQNQIEWASRETKLMGVAIGQWRDTSERMCFNAWLEYVQMCKRHKAITRKAVNMWCRRELSICFQALRDWVGIQKRNRKLIRNAVQHWKFGKLSQCFQGWREWKNDEKLKKKALRKSINWWKSKELTECFSIWRNWVLERKREKRIIQRAIQHWKYKELSECFHQWREWTEDEKIVRENSLHAIEHWKNSKLQYFFNWWVNWVEGRKNKRILMNKAVNYFRNKELSDAFYSWLDWVEEEKRIKDICLKALEMWKYSKLGQAFAEWKEWTEAKKRKRMLLSKALNYFKFQTLADAFYSWREWIEEEKRIKDICLKALNMWKYSKLSQAFAGWREWTSTKKRKRILLSKALNYFKSQTLADAFYSWREWVQEEKDVQRKLKNAVQMWKYRSLQDCFDIWKEWAQNNFRKRKLLEKGVNFFKNKELSSCFYIWKEWVEEEKHQKVTLRMVLDIWRERKLQSCFDVWKEWVKNEKRSKEISLRALNFFRDKEMSHAFYTWREWTKEEIEFREKVTKAMNYWKNSELYQFFLKWRKYVEDKKRIEVFSASAIEWWTNGSMTKSFAKWRVWVKYKKEKREKLRWIGNFAFLKSLSRCFYAWRDWASEEKRQRLLLKSTLDFWRHRHLYQSFNVWKEWIVEHKTNREKITNALTLWKYNKLSLFFSEWRSWAGKHKEKRILLNKSINYFRNRELCVCFENWAEWTKEEKRQKQVLSKAVHFCRNKTYYSCFTSWREFSQESIKEKQIIAKAVSHWKTTRLEFSFEQWKRWTLEEKSQKSILANAIQHWKNKELQLYFQVWVEWTSNKRSEANKLARVIQYWKYRELSSSFHIWREWTHEEMRQKYLLEKCVNMWRHKKVVFFFEYWSEWTYRKKEKKRVLGRAVKCWTNKILLASLYSWKEWVAEEKRQKELLRRITSFWKNRTLSKAFITWADWTHERLTLKTNEEKAEDFYRESLLLKVTFAWKEYARRELTYEQNSIKARNVCRENLIHRYFYLWAKKYSNKLEQDGLLRTVMVFWVRKTEKVCFNVLKLNAQERIHTRHQFGIAIKYHREDLLFKCFSALKQFKDVAQKKRDLLERAYVFYCQKLITKCRSAWEKWLAQMVSKRTAEQKAKQALMYWLNGTLFKTFQMWRSYTQTVNEIKLNHFSASIERYRMKKALAGFRMNVKKYKRRRVSIMQTFSTINDNFRPKWAMERWKEFILYRRGRREYEEERLKKYNRLFLRQLFKKWELSASKIKSERIIQERNRELKVAKAIACWSQRSMAKAFGSWLEFVDIRIQKKKIIQKAINFWKHSTITNCFEALRHNVSLEKETRMKAASLCMSHWVSVERRCFNKLKTNVQNAKTARVKAQELLDGKSKDLKMKCIGKWRRIVDEENLYRKKMAQSVLHWEGATVSKCFVSWACYITDQKRHFNHVLVFIKGLRKLYLSHYLKEWRNVVKTRKRLALLTLKAIDHSNKAAKLIALKAWLTQTLNARQREARAANMGKSKFLAKKRLTLNAWFEYTKLTKVRRNEIFETVAKRNSSMNLTIHFRAWAETTTKRKYLKMWSKYITKRREKRLKVVKAIAFSKQNSLEIAFDKWIYAKKASLDKTRYFYAWAHKFHFSEKENLLVHEFRRHQLLYRTIRDWKMRVHTSKKAVVEREKKVDELIRGTIMKRSFAAWKKRAIGCQVADYFEVSHRLNSAFQVWKSKMIYIEELYEKNIRIMNRNRRKRAFQKWKTEYSNNYKGASFAVERNRKIASKVLAKWSEAAIIESEIFEKKIMFAEEFCRLKHLGQSFFGWRKVSVAEYIISPQKTKRRYSSPAF
eukprot:Nk52_evm25s1810 gene=Nk52_evmTU25s1810